MGSRTRRSRIDCGSIKTDIGEGRAFSHARERKNRRVSNAERDPGQGTVAVAAPCSMRPYLPILPDLGDEKGQQARVLALRTARAPLLRLEGVEPTRRHRDPHLRGAVLRLRHRYARGG